MISNRRLWLAGGATALLPVVLAVGFGHAGQHMARSVLVPGAGLYDERPAIGLALTALFVVATVAWLRWGIDWSVLLVVVLAVVVSGLLAETGHPSEDVAAAAHEFPLVILVLAAYAWLRGVVRKLPLPRIRLRPERTELPPVDRCRAVAVGALAGVAVDGADAPDVAERARRINLVARARAGEPFQVDHAHARAALALTGRLDAVGLERLRADARR